MLVVIRLSPLAKNVPQRNRCGHKFSHEPAVADLTDDQVAEVRDDPYLKICNFPSVAWFDAFGFERTQTNENIYREDPPKKIPASARIASRVGEISEGAGKAPARPGETGADEEASGKKTEPVKPVELTSASPKEEIVKALQKRGKIEGKDFNKDASAESLFKLLATS